MEETLLQIILEQTKTIQSLNQTIQELLSEKKTLTVQYQPPSVYSSEEEVEEEEIRFEEIDLGELAQPQVGMESDD